MEQLKLEFAAKKSRNCFVVIPSLHIEHKKFKGFAIVVSWGHYLAGVRFYKDNY